MDKQSGFSILTALLVTATLTALIFVGYYVLNQENEQTPNIPVKVNDSGQTAADRSGMLLTLATPRVDDEYYADSYEQIVEFQIEYAQAIIDAGHDSVQILADAQTIADYANQLPDGVFVESPMLDIWMRDFTLVNPTDPVQFIYTDASMSQAEAIATQKQFDDHLNSKDITHRETDLIIDGGNIVDDYQGRVITTTRFLTDNDLTIAEGKQRLKEVLGASQVAIIEPDDEALAHSDGMVAWLDDSVLAVNDYSQEYPDFHDLVMDELRATFGDITYVLLPVEFDDDQADPNIGSACGININLVMSNDALYVPTFGQSHEAEALQLIRDSTSLDVIEVPAQGVCRYGGSARCTVWQQQI